MRSGSTGVPASHGSDASPRRTTCSASCTPRSSSRPRRPPGAAWRELVPFRLRAGGQPDLRSDARGRRTRRRRLGRRRSGRASRRRSTPSTRRAGSTTRCRRARAASASTTTRRSRSVAAPRGRGARRLRRRRRPSRRRRAGDLLGRPARVLTISIHQYVPGWFFRGRETRRARRSGGRGVGDQRAAPPRTPATTRGSRRSEAIVPAVERFGPDVLVTQLGCDTHVSDPLANLRLYDASYRACAGGSTSSPTRPPPVAGSRPAAAGYQWVTPSSAGVDDRVRRDDRRARRAADELPEGFIEEARERRAGAARSRTTFSGPRLGPGPAMGEDRARAVADAVASAVLGSRRPGPSSCARWVPRAPRPRWCRASSRRAPRSSGSTARTAPRTSTRAACRSSVRRSSRRPRARRPRRPPRPQGAAARDRPRPAHPPPGAAVRAPVRGPRRRTRRPDDVSGPRRRPPRRGPRAAGGRRGRAHRRRDPRRRGGDRVRPRRDRAKPSGRERARRATEPSAGDRARPCDPRARPRPRRRPGRAILRALSGRRRAAPRRDGRPPGPDRREGRDPAGRGRLRADPGGRGRGDGGPRGPRRGAADGGDPARPEAAAPRGA